MKNFVFKTIIFTLSIILISSFSSFSNAEETRKVNNNKPAINIKITGIPQGQQSIFVPLMLDTAVADVESVDMKDLSAHNILGVTSDAMSMVGPGIGLLKLDNTGLPKDLNFKVYLKEKSKGQTNVSLVNFSNSPVLPSKGTSINSDTKITISSGLNPEVIEKEVNGKKKLSLTENKLVLNVSRTGQKEETIFIPMDFDNKIVDLDESFGHAIIAPGISAKTFSHRSLSNEGAGVEIILTSEAEKDFNLPIDLVPKSIGMTTVTTAFPQTKHTRLIKGPVVEIIPSTVTTGLAKG